MELGSDCISIYGSLDPDEKIARLHKGFSGENKYLVSKCSIFGFGCNFQQCARELFLGINDSWESYYQGVRRIWRFGQKRDVHVHMIVASTEGNVIQNLKRKDREAEEMADEMAENTKDLTRMNLIGTSRTSYHYKEEKDGNVILPTPWTWAREMGDDSIHFSVFSPPFEMLYCYSSSD